MFALLLRTVSVPRGTTRIPAAGDDYGLEVGRSADLVVLDCTTAEEAVAELAVPLYGFRRGRMSFARKPVELFGP